MRIYGGHDYYDCGLRMGIDPTITLIRGKSKSVPVEKVGLVLGIVKAIATYLKDVRANDEKPSGEPYAGKTLGL